MNISKEESQILIAKNENSKRSSRCMILWGIVDIGLFFAFCFGIVYFGISIQRPNSSSNVLRFNDKGEFTIMQVGLLRLIFTQITDSHYDDDVRDTTLTHFCLETVLAHENPDFVAFTGDMVTGYNWDGKQGWFKKQWLKFSERMTRLRIPYAYVLGNHDVEVDMNEMCNGQADLSREAIVALDRTNPYSLTQLGPPGPHNSTNISFQVVIGCFLHPVLCAACIQF